MNKKELKIVLRKLREALGLKTIIFLIVLLSFNTYAWFVFSSRVDTEMGAKVRAWNITFLQADQNVSQAVTFDVDDIYPGMADFHDEVTITNNGDTNATIGFEITSVRVLNTTYTVGSTYTSDGIVDMLSDDYPFKVTLAISNSTIPAGSSEKFSVDVEWDFEENDDSVDTLWGEAAYTYNHTNPTSPSISINLVLKIDQTN